MVEVDARSFGTGLLSAVVTTAAYAVTLGRRVATKDDLEGMRSEVRREAAQLVASQQAVLDEKVRHLELKIEAAERHAKRNEDVVMKALIEGLLALVEEMREARRGG